MWIPAGRRHQSSERKIRGRSLQSWHVLGYGFVQPRREARRAAIAPQRIRLYPARLASRCAPVILKGLHEIARAYDAAFCDVWGVLHDGRSARRPAVETLRRFRKECGPVILLSNAPRPVSDVETQFSGLHIPHDCYDAVLTSGVLAHDDLDRKSV